MFHCDVKLPPGRPRFSQSDPAEMMPTYEPSSLSREQQEQLDAFKFETMKSDYEYFRDHPEIGDVVGYIFERVLFDRPVNINQYILKLFQQPDIKSKIMEFRKDRKCHRACSPNTENCHTNGSTDIEEVTDLGYKIVEGPNGDPCGRSHVDQRICDDRMLSRHRHIVMEHMKAMYENRGSMLPSYNMNLDIACDDLMKNVQPDPGLIGAPEEVPMYGGDYIFLRNTRCGRSIAQYIGDIHEIPTRPWPYESVPSMGSALSGADGEEETLFTPDSTRTELASAEEDVKDEVEEAASNVRSHESSSVLRGYYFETDPNTKSFELDNSVLEKYFHPKAKIRNIELELSDHRLSKHWTSVDHSADMSDSDESGHSVQTR